MPRARVLGHDGHRLGPRCGCGRLLQLPGAQCGGKRGLLGLGGSAPQKHLAAQGGLQALMLHQVVLQGLEKGVDGLDRAREESGRRGRGVRQCGVLHGPQS